MAVIACDLISDRTGTNDTQGSTRAVVANSFIQRWRVQTNDPLDGPHVVVNHPGLPALYSPYSSGNDTYEDALLLRKTPEEEGDSHRSWIVTCEYNNEYQLYPLLEPTLYSMSFDQYTQVARMDVNGFPLNNSMGQAFTPPPEADWSRPVFIARRNEAFINTSFVIDMVDSVNASVWKGWAPRTVKCKSINIGEQQLRNGTYFHEVTYEFHLFWQTWDYFILNQSTLFVQDGITIPLLPGEEPITVFTGGDGSTNGEIVPRGSTVTRDQVYMRYRIYRERNFNLFPF